MFGLHRRSPRLSWDRQTAWRLLSRVAFASAVTLLASVQASAQETPLVVSFESADYRMLEGEELRVNVVVTPAPDREVTIPITVAPYHEAGTPAENGDYTVQGLGAGGALTFAVGDAVETFVVRAEEDNRDNEIEDVAFDFGSLPSGVTSVRPGNRYGAMLRILDNDWKATLSKRDNHPPERPFMLLPFTDPDGDKLEWWLDGPDADYFLVFPFHKDGTSTGVFFLGGDTVWDSDVKDTYTFIFYLSDGMDVNGDPDGGLPDHRGVLVVTVTPGPEIVLQPASVPEGTETEVRITLSHFLPANDQVTISVSGQCGLGGALSVTGGGTLSITTDGDGAANVVVPFTAGAGAGDTRCEVVATGSVVPTGSIESDTAAATLVVLEDRPDGPALTNVRADPDTITVGEKSTLSWTPRGNVESVVVSGGGEELATVFTATDTSYEVRPTETTTYTLSAQDSEGAALGDFTVTVTAVRPPDGPALSDVRADPDTITVGEKSTLSWTPREDVESVVVSAGDEELATVFTATDTAYVVRPTETTTYSLSVQDSEGAPLGDFPVTVTVLPRPPANGAPTVSASCDPCEVAPGGEVRLSTTASDPDGDPLTYAWSALRGSFSGATDGATARWTAPAQIGRVTIRVQVSDGRGGSASADVAVEVTDRPRPPTNGAPTVSASCDPCEVAPGGEVRLSTTASDPDGDPLTYAWSALRGSFSGATDGATARWTAPAQIGRVTIRVQVSDGRGGSASADVAVEVSNRPPAFQQSTYHFELPENQDGSQRPIELGRVTAEDPEGDALTYELVSGDSERFAIGHRDGVVAYVGLREDFEVEPNRYDLTVRVRDAFGAEARAQVVVTVTNANESPEARDDEARTLEDQSVTVDVLANDTDPDGDRLRLETVSAAAHGTTRITAGGAVTYTPEANYHGADRFTYVVSDGAGETATAAVDVTVLTVNDRPVAVGVIPDQVLDEGGGEVAVDLSPFFDDPDGDTLSFRAVSSDTEVVTVMVSEAVLTLSPVVYGSASVTVTAEDPGGLSATQTFRVGVSNRLVKAVLGNTLAAMGRGHLASARMTLGRRVTAGKDERARLTVMGRSVPLEMDAAQAALGPIAAHWRAGSSASLYGVSGGATELASVPGGGFGAADLGGPSTGGRFPGSDQVLRGTDFLLALGGGGPGETRPGRRWTLWGQGDIQTFQGTPSAFGYDSRYDGDLRTGYLGVDVRLTDRWLAGLALSRSRGAGDWHVGTARGRLTTPLTAAHPYLHWSNGTTSVTAMGGRGWGEAKNGRETTGRVGTSALGLNLGLVEVRRRLGTAGGGVEFGVRGDAGWAQLKTERGQETVDGISAAVNQTRLGAEVSRPIRMRSGLALMPFGEVNARRDGGAGQTGTGLEFAGGLRAAYGMLRLDAQGRLLTLHSATGYQERGAGVTLSVGKAGAGLSLAPSWGDQASGADTLWQDQVYRRHRPGAARDAWALDARADYGVRLRSGRLLTWFGSYGQSWHGPRFQFGVRLGVLGNGVPPGRGSAEAGRIKADGRRTRRAGLRGTAVPPRFH